MYPGTVYVSTKFRPDRTSNMAARRPSWKTNLELLTRNFVHVLLRVTRIPNIGPIWSSSWPPGGQDRKQKKCYNSWTNDWISSKCLSWVHLIRIHDIVPGFLIRPTSQGHGGQSSSTSVSMACFVTTQTIDLKLCTYHSLRVYSLQSVKIYSQHKLCHEAPREHIVHGPCGHFIN
jgi:hypothetical protein